MTSVSQFWRCLHDLSRSVTQTRMEVDKLHPSYGVEVDISNDFAIIGTGSQPAGCGICQRNSVGWTEIRILEMCE